MKFLWMAVMLLTGVITMGSEKLLTQPPAATIRKADSEKFMTGMYGFCVLRPNTDMMKLIPADAKFNLGTDGKNINITVQCPVGPDGILERARAGRGGTRAFMDDSFEFVFVPNPTEKMPNIYHLITNNRGSFMAQGRKGSGNVAWEPEFKQKGSVKDGIWTFEISIPLASIGIDSLKEGQTFGMRICRNWRRMNKDFGNEWGVQSSWSQIRGAFFDSESIPLVTYSENAPVVRFIRLKKNGKADIRVSLFNPTPQAMTLKTTWILKPSSSQSIDRSDSYELKSGETKEIQLPVAQLTDGETVTSAFQVASSDGKTVYYRRAFRWDVANPPIFDKGGSDKERIASKFAYYPESDRMFITMDLSTVKEIAKVKKITAAIKDKSGKTLAEKVLPPHKNGITELLWQLPKLKEITQKSNPSGEYRLLLMVDGIEDAKITKNFERKIFPWEGNSLGKSDRLIPPFTPIQVKGNQVSTILRDHTLNGLGLWKQVKADGENLLKENGITLEAVINGKTYTADGKLLFDQKTPTKVSAKSRWSAGSLKGTALSEFDYDGMMKYTLTLEASPRKIDSLKLLIPLDEKNAYLFHACTDGLRFNYGGATPKGEGRVWDSTKAARTDLQTSYVPYLWLGTEGRGLSVFGNSDKGWVLNKALPQQELIRKNGNLYLVFHLIANPIELKTSREIVLGFQATPVKPMIREWRKNAIWSTPETAKKYLNYYMSFLGSSLCQGGVSSSDCIFPRDMDTSLWEMYAQIRKTKQIPAGYRDQWCAGYKHATPERMKTYRAEINYALHVMKGAPKDSVTFYTNARGVRIDIPEARTFLDDWLREEFQGSRDRAPEYGASKSYSLDPVESFRDFGVTWYHKMLTSGACDNIYWDDIFLAANFDRSGTGDAYPLEDGRIQPHIGLWNQRELFRRTAVMQLEIGRSPNNMVHMTNTAITPLLSFAQQNLDWEDNLGSNPFQQRYTKEYIRAVSIGRQFGNLPGALGLVITQGDKKAIEWCLRTGAGVTLTHEIMWTKGGAAKDYWKVLTEMLPFGYGTDAVRVWNYWEKGYPVDISGDTSSILLSKKGEAILIVCDYAEGGDFTAKLDLKKLGFRKISAINGETGAALNVNGETISFQLKKYDFIYMKIKGE